ncbi:ATP-dependent RNA helicase [Spironucleus salmonicida]|uniref:ATP-dependent RNA helicase n=1 Tax=Spironucleus salmonicida TaxID=348837 RepID=V6LN47_9EUKA|nr:ATP-dependent RNA helicase [Spironucleus salmonicida]|eukprot:EST45643.1 ATP-dependent RNA helicase [Spironucleus salmonicida]
MSWKQFKLSQQLLTNIISLGWETPTQVQFQSIPLALTSRDILVSSHTGTGKTGSFLIPLIQRISLQTQQRRTQVLILSPTRELAEQTFKVAQLLGDKISTVALITSSGPVRAQEIVLSSCPQIVIATPGRLIDHIMNSLFMVNDIEVLVLDECDKMLELGFYKELLEIIKNLPEKRQTLLFSATAQAVSKIAGEALNKPMLIQVDPVKSIGKNIDQQFIILNNFMGLLDSTLKFHGIGEKYILKCCIIHQLLEKSLSGQKVIIFCNYKSSVKLLHYFLEKLGSRTIMFSGEMGQQQRTETINDFNEDFTPIISTDLLSRGIDIKQVDTVIQFEIGAPDSYIHRAGRTGRASLDGVAISIGYQKEVQILTQQLSKMKFNERVIDMIAFSKILSNIDTNFLEEINISIKEEEIVKQEKEIQRQIEKTSNIDKYSTEILSSEKRKWMLDTKEKHILQQLKDQVKQGSIKEKDAKQIIQNKGLKEQQRKLKNIAVAQKRASKNIASRLPEDLKSKIKKQKMEQRNYKGNNGAFNRNEVVKGTSLVETGKKSKKNGK